MNVPSMYSSELASWMDGWMDEYINGGIGWMERLYVRMDGTGVVDGGKEGNLYERKDVWMDG